jgi:hypothetical protein
MPDLIPPVLRGDPLPSVDEKKDGPTCPDCGGPAAGGDRLLTQAEVQELAGYILDEVAHLAQVFGGLFSESDQLILRKRAAADSLNHMAQDTRLTDEGDRSERTHLRREAFVAQLALVSDLNLQIHRVLARAGIVEDMWMGGIGGFYFPVFSITEWGGLITGFLPPFELGPGNNSPPSIPLGPPDIPEAPGLALPLGTPTPLNPPAVDPGAPMPPVPEADLSGNPPRPALDPGAPQPPPPDEIPPVGSPAITPADAGGTTLIGGPGPQPARPQPMPPPPPPPPPDGGVVTPPVEPEPEPPEPFEPRRRIPGEMVR